MTGTTYSQSKTGVSITEKHIDKMVEKTAVIKENSDKTSEIFFD